jgi:hypothetical protein
VIDEIIAMFDEIIVVIDSNFLFPARSHAKTASVTSFPRPTFHTHQRMKLVAATRRRRSRCVAQANVEH